MPEDEIFLQYPATQDIQERESSFFLFLSFSFLFFSHLYTTSAILNFALLERGFRAVSSSEGTITLLLINRKGEEMFP